MGNDLRQVCIATALFIMLLLDACGADGTPSDQPVSSEDTVLPTKAPVTVVLEQGETAIIESLDVLVMESFPLQVSVALRGQLPDGCTSVLETRVTYDEKAATFNIQVITGRPKDAICIEVLQPFKANVPLDVYGLPAGEYTILVYDKKATFTFAQDNILAE